MRRISITYLVLCIGLGAWVSAADGQDTLYTLNVSGPGNVLSVDIETGSTTSLAPGLASGFASWTGLASHPTNTEVLYALHNPGLFNLDDPQFSRIAKIDPNTGQSELFPLFDVEVLGYPEVFGAGIAISPAEPEQAVVVGQTRGFPPTPLIWKANLVDGSAAGPAKELTFYDPESGSPLDVGRLEAITYSPDGALIGTDDEGRLVNIDLDTGDVVHFGDPELTNFLTGIVFDPSNDELLYAINGHQADELVTLNAKTGELIQQVGSLGIRGPEGLAFISQVSLDFDCNADGAVDLDDLTCANANNITAGLLEELHLLPGDLDGVNGVRFADFLLLSRNFAKNVSTYPEGDINNDKIVNFADFLIFAENFGKSHPDAAGSLASVPEPLFSPLMACATLLITSNVWRPGKRKT